MSTDPTLLARLPDVIAAQIEIAMPELREAAGHDGRFDEAELAAFATRAPGVRVALLGLGRATPLGGPAWEHAARLAAFVVAKDQPGLRRDEGAAAIVQRLLSLIPGNRWGVPDIGIAEGIDAQNLYGAKLRKMGIALWAIGWTHQVQIVAPGPGPGYVLPAEVYAKGLEADGEPVQVSGDV